jgi:hypothetical protein
LPGTKLKLGSEAKNHRPVELPRPDDVRQLIESILDASLVFPLSAQIVRPAERVVIVTCDTGSEYYLPVRVPDGNPVLSEVFS